MVAAISAALSGLANASTRFETSANNIANQFSTSSIINGVATKTPYVPKDVVSLSQEAGGVFSELQDAENPFTQQFNAATNSLETVPNVDITQELVNQKIAAYDFRANLKTIQAVDNMQQNLLDIFS